MQKSEQINDLAKALATARGSFNKVEKSSSNPFYKSKYADLAVIIDATYKSLSDNGLSVMQFPGEVNGGAVTILTMLLHASGQWVSEETTMPVSKNDAQGVGSALTYGRRYALQSLLNVAAEEDDDGNAAVVKSNSVAKVSSSRIQELCEWLANAKDIPELQRIWMIAKQEGVDHGDRKAIEALTAAKEARKKEIA